MLGILFTGNYLIVNFQIFINFVHSTIGNHPETFGYKYKGNISSSFSNKNKHNYLFLHKNRKQPPFPIDSTYWLNPNKISYQHFYTIYNITELIWELLVRALLLINPKLFYGRVRHIQEGY